MFFKPYYVEQINNSCNYETRARVVFRPFPKIEIVKKYKEDIGLLAHEQTHVRQWLRLPFIHPILYKFNSRYRYKAELEAFKVQYQHSTSFTADGVDRAELFAGFIKDLYNVADASPSKQNIAALLRSLRGKNENS